MTHTITSSRSVAVGHTTWDPWTGLRLDSFLKHVLWCAFDPLTTWIYSKNNQNVACKSSKHFDYIIICDDYTAQTGTQVPFINAKSTQFVPEWSLHHVSKFTSHLLQVSSSCFFGPPMLDWDTLLVDMSPPANLSTSPVQIVTIGTYWTHLPSFNTSYRLLDEKIHCFSWKIVKKVITN